MFLIIFSIFLVQKVISDCVPCKNTIEMDSLTADCRFLPSITTCKYDDIPNMLDPEIKILRMRNQSLKILHDNVFIKANISKIVLLEMSSCGMMAIEKGAFKNLSYIVTIIAAHNNISEILVGTFEDNIRLEVLNFSYNNIKELKNGLFDNLVYLKVLRIENNAIHTIGDKLFNRNLKLNKLKLSYNKLEYLDGNIFEKLKANLKLSIENNPWQCTCRLWSFYNMSLKFLENKPTLPQCENYKNLRSSVWTKLEEKDFQCKPKINFYTLLDSKSNNITLVCEVIANPKPTSINWYSFVNNRKECASTNFSPSEQKKFTFYNHISITRNSKYTRFFTCVADQHKRIKIEQNITTEEIEQRVSQSNDMDSSEEEMEMFLLSSEENTAEPKKEECIPKVINAGNTIQFNCPSSDPLNVAWFCKGFRINEDVVKMANGKYEIHSLEDQNKSVLVVKDLEMSDIGTYKCTNSKDNEDLCFQLSLTEMADLSNTDSSPILPIALGVILIVLLVIFIITLCYLIRRKRAQNPSSALYKVVDRNSTNEYVTNKNEYMEESTIYVSSDNNIYEDIIYGPAGK